MKFEANNVVLMCRKNSSCNCPRIKKVSDDEFHMLDDFGNTVKYNRSDMEYLAEEFSNAFRQLDKNV